MRIFDNVLVMLRGSLVAQVISFAALPVLARLYAPADFARYQIFQSVVGFLLLAASFRYEVAVLNAESDEYAFSLARLCVVLNGALAGLTLLCCVAIRIVDPTLVDKLGSALWLLPSVLLAGGVFQTITYLLLRSSAFRESSAARGIQALANTSTAFGLGTLRMTDVGLVAADLAGRVVAIVYSCARMVPRDPRYLLWRDRAYPLAHLLRKFREYPLIALPGALLDLVGGSMTTVLMLGVFGAATSGQYALVERSVLLPIGVIAQAISQVYMASFSSALRSDARQAAALYRRVVVTQLKIGIVPAIALVLLGRPVFEVLFGAQWSQAGQFAQIMSPLFLASFILAPVTMTLLMLKKQKLNFAWYVCRLSMVLATWLVISRLNVQPASAMAIHVTVNLAAYGLLAILTLRSLPTVADASRPASS